ncbi:hypothetical protein OEA41_003136 [Lepraria neglecta]|uniref:Life-span regulatory factor-domain-containing protein n=1 Tax=Lepraria neglecta TaxID=209136 RepID=A0AAD9Z757_9LECA|nr:hypothetical protein OEA41_003136 [Lepraria neglecta]
MSSSQHVHVTTRRSPPHVRKTARSAPSSKSAGTAKATKRAKEEDEEIFEDDNDDMGSSFLQFCAMCEKQIVVPNSSILYCSESCRHRDSIMPPTHPYLTLALNSPNKMMPSTLSFDIDGPFGSRIPTYVPRAQRTPRSLYDDRIPPMTHDGTSDLDPTEWKPAEPSDTERKSPGKSGEWKPKLAHRPSSEAFSYLSKFHRSSDSLASKRRPALGHGRSTSRTTPSLSHTPTASTSSEESLVGTPYEFVGRPAISMPTVSTITSASEGINVVKDGNDLTYEKKHVGASFGSATGSLKKLLGTATGGK